MNIAPKEDYKKGAFRAVASILSTDDNQFRGVVQITQSGEERRNEEHLVPVTSDTPEEAFDEAKALAHRILANLQ